MKNLSERYSKQEDLTFPGMSLHDFMRKTSVYEHEPLPFSPRLRRATHLGLGLTLLSTVLIIGLPLLARGLPIIFFPLLPSGLNQFMLHYLQGLSHVPLIGYGNSALLTAGGVLLLLTRNLRYGGIAQQGLACALAVGGSLSLALVLLPVLIITANVFGWLLVILCVMLLLALLLRLLGLHARF